MILTKKILSILLSFFILTGCSSRNATSYIVSFNSNGGTTVLSKEVKNSSKVEKPKNPTKIGYIFDGWYLNDKEYDFKKKVTKDIVLRANWANDETITRYKVMFDTNGGTEIEGLTIPENTAIYEPNIPKKDGCKFKEWQLDDNKYDFASPVFQDVTLIAIWEETKFIVTFDSNGGSKIASINIGGDSKISKPQNPTRAGYNFIEWQLDGESYNFNKVITRDITLKAYWIKAKTFTVTFDSTSGTQIAPKIVYEGSKITAPTNPTKTGSVFMEWQLDGVKYNFNNTITKNITLKAKWTDKYTVTFDSSGGSKVNSIDVQIGEKVLKPSNPTKDGNSFIEWQLNGIAYDFNQVLTNNITLIAKWNVSDIYKFSYEILEGEDEYRIINSYKNDILITNVKEIKLGSETIATYDDKINALKILLTDIENRTAITIVLSDNTTYTAIKK